jgi:hypothetical protein
MLKKKELFSRKGKRIISSMSKIKNNKATKKNWIEKGARKENLGSNPHSNGLFFSVVSFDIFITIITILPIRRANKTITTVRKKSK